MWCWILLRLLRIFAKQPSHCGHDKNENTTSQSVPANIGGFFLHLPHFPLGQSFFFAFPWHLKLRNIRFWGVFLSFSVLARPISNIIDNGSNRKHATVAKLQRFIWISMEFCVQKHSFTTMANADKNKKNIHTYIGKIQGKHELLIRTMNR